MTGEGEGPTEAGQGPASVGNRAGHCRGGSSAAAPRWFACCGAERRRVAELRVAQARGGDSRDARRPARGEFLTKAGGM